MTALNVNIESGSHPTLKAGRYVKISIQDSGVGIPSEIKSKIFDPFFTTKKNGHGLGLSTCYSIASRHHGFIDVESEELVGSTFHLYLPASTETVEKQITVNSEKHLGNGTILVMDDEPFILDIVGEILESLGYSVICKVNGKEVIDLFQKQPSAVNSITAMIFDLTIPGAMGGIEAVSHLRKMNVTIPIFVASGYASDPVVANPSEYGFTGSISKPFTRDELVALLNKYL